GDGFVSNGDAARISYETPGTVDELDVHSVVRRQHAEDRIIDAVRAVHPQIIPGDEFVSGCRFERCGHPHQSESQSTHKGSHDNLLDCSDSIEWTLATREALPAPPAGTSRQVVD